MRVRKSKTIVISHFNNKCQLQEKVERGKK